MSVIKAKRKPSKLEVFHHLYILRREITDLLLRDFGYSVAKHDRRINRLFSGKQYDELSENQKHNYDIQKSRQRAFEEWFIADERKIIIDCLRSITEEIFMANSIYPTCQEELIERRLHQDRAIGYCNKLSQELQYIIETLPVDINKYTRFADDIQTEIDLIKSWRKSDNKFKAAISEIHPRISLM